MSERRYTPTVVHISTDGLTYLCDAKSGGSWHDRCMSNQFVDTLPICEECSQKPSPLKEVQRDSPIPIHEATPIGVFVKDYRRE